MKKSLNGTWQGVCFGADGSEEFTFSGTVPGCVHTDLAGSRLPADLNWRDNADLCQWIEDKDWSYSREFTLEEVPENACLVFEGLDTYAEIFLNGLHLGSVDNMFIAHRFPVESRLRVGENTLSVRFRSPVREVAGKPRRKASFGTFERIYTRRIQCTYGWDWVARFVTCGIWRDVYLESRVGFGLKDAYIYTDSIYPGGAQIVVEAEFENYQQGGVAELEIVDPEGKTVYRHSWFRREPDLKAYIDLPDARLWYPAGYGEQPLYTLRLCGREIPFGIRTVSIRQLPDAPGTAYHELCLTLKKSPSGEEYDRNEEFSGFLLLVNDQPILCKGANWVPSEPFPSAETDGKLTELLELAREAGISELYFMAIKSFDFPDNSILDEFDGVLLFQPHAATNSKKAKGSQIYVENLLRHLPEKWVEKLRTLRTKNRTGHKLYEYQKIWDIIHTDTFQYKDKDVFNMGFMGWDNTARYRNKATVYDGCTPEIFEKNFRRLYEKAGQKADGKQFVYINAWNEWAEGTYLEPDTDHGYGYLEAIERITTERR